MKRIVMLVVAICVVFVFSAFAKVNINTATKEQLMAMKGVGDKKAEAILAYRKANGAFKTLADLGKVDGIGDKMLESLKDQICLSDKDCK